jgi:aspartate-semialdehyde dehydrogenase
MRTYQVGILGATGLVGQRLIELLTDHPWFRIRVLAASDRSAGKPYAEAASWQLAGRPATAIGRMVVRPCRVEELGSCDLVFSALDTAVAQQLEPRVAEAGLPVISNSSAFRQHAEVPLIVPEVNATHLSLIEDARRRNDGGFIVTNPNCSTTGLVVALAPLHRAFGLRNVVVSTMQAVSGAGLAGPSALQLLANVVPYIPGEEEKMEQEVGKILGRVDGVAVARQSIAVSAHCHRVPTIDGHLEAVSVGFERRTDLAAVRSAMDEFRGELEPGVLPSATHRPLVVRDEPDRPQPRLDCDAGNGMTVVVGRLRPCPVLDFRFVVLSHNTIRGAAGGALLNAELLAARDLLPTKGSAA